MFNRMTVLGMLLVAMLSAACERKGPFEEAGENLDDATEEVADAVEDACEDLTDEDC